MSANTANPVPASTDETRQRWARVWLDADRRGPFKIEGAADVRRPRDRGLFGRLFG